MGWREGGKSEEGGEEEGVKGGEGGGGSQEGGEGEGVKRGGEGEREKANSLNSKSADLKTEYSSPEVGHATC